MNLFPTKISAYHCSQEIRSKIKVLIDWLEDLTEEVRNCLVTASWVFSEVERQQQQQQQQQSRQNIVAEEENEAPSTLICFQTKTELFWSGYGYRPHYNAENDHRKRSHSKKTLSSVERFENDAFWKRCFLV